MLHLLDTYAAGISLLCSALFECIAVSWFYGKHIMFDLKSINILEINLFFYVDCLGLEKFCDDVESMIGHRPGLYWRLCWKFVSPMFIIVSLENIIQRLIFVVILQHIHVTLGLINV